MTIAIATFRCKPGQRQGWLDYLAGPDGLVKTRAFDGCGGVETIVASDSEDVVLCERWASAEHHQAHVAWRLDNGLGELLEAVLASPLEVAYFDETSI
ncbi:MAG: antibiotic biosynthesis monooxygenase [Actinomycetota bacterium]|nr:antibiotic biosynthesis monooxygenase [Actinomycetota bacterium]MDA3034745.1 antibiotic biosynthesis monooxygenase [Actinomycetota bacterium]